MPIIYVYRCDCGKELEDSNPSPPLCVPCGKLMPRKMRIFRGCSRPSNKAVSPREAHEQAFYKDQDNHRDKQVKRVENNKTVRRRSLRKYGAADMHNRHGIGADGLTKSARKIEEMK